MGEVFSWPEGKVSFWTGSATASTVVTYAENTRLMIAYGWDNYRTLDSAYHDRFTGQRADFTIGALYTTDLNAIRALVESKTAVHVHFAHSAALGSAGHLLYTAVIDNLSLAGSKNGLYQWQCAGHANAWSAY